MGLVVGDPGDDVDSVTIAVDATAAVAVVHEVPDRGLLLAHHPLLLRGVDTVAANTAKGALLHQMIRSRRALFTAHTNADSAWPGVFAYQSCGQSAIRKSDCATRGVQGVRAGLDSRFQSYRGFLGIDYRMLG